jgi:hypothetical protein
MYTKALVGSQPSIQPASSPNLWHPTRKNHQGIERESTTTTHHCITMIWDPTRKEISKELCVCVCVCERERERERFERKIIAVGFRVW